MKHVQPKAIGSIIDSTISHLGIGRRLKDFEVMDRWPQIVGEQIAKVAVPQRLENGKLFVHVSQAPWRNELVFLKNALIQKINKDMEQEIVTDIIFR